MRCPSKLFGSALILSSLLAASSAGAVDGVILIDQNKALAGGVTPGDSPGFPITISQPGSYRLSGNLSVPNQSTTAIEVRTENVTIDLNGFSILGPGLPAPALPGRPGRGIVSTFQPGDGTTYFAFGYVTVTNGVIAGLGNMAIDLGPGSQVTNMRVHNNAQGIYVGAASIVTGNVVRFNGGVAGITAESLSVVRSNTVSGVGAGGRIFHFCFGSIVGNAANEISGFDGSCTRDQNYPAP